MLPLVLSQLEALRADLAAIDPAGEIDAADRVAAMAVQLRDVLAAHAADRACEAAVAAAVRVAAVG